MPAATPRCRSFHEGVQCRLTTGHEPRTHRGYRHTGEEIAWESRKTGRPLKPDRRVTKSISIDAVTWRRLEELVAARGVKSPGEILDVLVARSHAQLR